MEDDFCKVADLIDNAIEITAFICSKLDGGAKAPLKVTYSALQWNLDQGQFHMRIFFQFSDSQKHFAFSLNVPVYISFKN